MTADTLPPALAEIVEDFSSAPPRDRLELLLEYADMLPPLPERYREHPERLEPVPRVPVAAVCRDRGRAATGPSASTLHAPQEAPTTRGFAGILRAGLDGLPAEEVLAVPPDLTARLALSEVVSPLRLRGAAALQGRIQRRVRELQGGSVDPAAAG